LANKTAFTAAQLEAISCDAENILVSAAAGSGKTAVLTERILRHVRSGKNIDDLLVVTFTEAASAEMRERIKKKLEEAGLDTQVARLPLANISTIHAFCRKLVQENFQVVDVDPAFRVADMAELALLRTQVMDELFEAEYTREGNDDFLDLAYVYGGKTMDGRLDVLVRKIFDFIESAPFPLDKAREYSNVFDIGDCALEDTPWAKIIRDELKLGLEGAIEGLTLALAICAKAGGPGKYAQKLEEEREMMEDLLELTQNGCAFTEMYKAFFYIDWGRLPSIRNDDVDPELKKQVTDIRDTAVKKRINKLVEGIFFAPPGKMAADLDALRPRVAAILDLTVKFSEAFAIEKRARNVLDFADLEHFAIQILYQEGGHTTEQEGGYTAEQEGGHTTEQGGGHTTEQEGGCTTEQEGSHVSKQGHKGMLAGHRFYEVLVDEYQDSNEVQDLILSAVAKRRFMVGDVKQSIYRFRRADPGLFIEKYRRYSSTNDGTCINLSHNFRSRPEVLDAVNFFFGQLMCTRVGDVDYDDNAALHTGFDEYPTLHANDMPQMWVEILDQTDDDTSEHQLNDITINEDELDDTTDNVVAETRMIAKTILELIETRKVFDEETKTLRPCRAGDIAVLTRSLSSVAGAMVEELKNHGIDAIADMDAGFLEQLEIKTALAFLRVIDNPRQDIELITVLHSPVYDITEDDLLQIRLCDVCEDEPMFFDRVLEYVNRKNLLSEKLSTFLSDLSAWRTAALHMPISRLIGNIYNITKYPAHVLAMPGGNIRQANLRLLLERAMEFEETSLTGLFHFVNYIERLYESGAKTSGAIAEPSPNPAGRVRIMTIHKSKGLEFSVVICAFLGKQFNTDDLRQPVIMHPELGVGPYYIDTEKRTRANTLARFSLSRLWARESLSEEMRCLYVAFTRAKELLVLSARCKDLNKAIQKWGNVIGTNSATLPVYHRSSVKSYLDWIMPCLLRHHSTQEFSATLEVNRKSPIWSHPANFRFRRHRMNDVSRHIMVKNYSSAVIAEQTCDDGYILQPFPDLQHSALPSKLSISEIKRLYDITPDSTSITNDLPSFDSPAFLRVDAGLTPMQIGSALHIITEHLDFTLHNTPQAIEELITHLTEKNLLSPEEATFIDREKIYTLINSPLAARIRISPRVYRETPFILALPGAELYQENPAAQLETVLVHGIIDCFFEEDGDVVLVDYKSDTQHILHKTQMEIYRKAIANATAMNVKEVLIYSFALGKAIALTASNICDGR